MSWWHTFLAWIDIGVWLLLVLTLLLRDLLGGQAWRAKGGRASAGPLHRWWYRLTYMRELRMSDWPEPPRELDRLLRRKLRRPPPVDGGTSGEPIVDDEYDSVREEKEGYDDGLPGLEEAWSEIEHSLRYSVVKTLATGPFPIELPIPPLAPLDPRTYRVWFGTNRAPVDPADPGKGFTGERCDLTHYGHCDVLVPQTHRIGSIGSSWVRRLVSGKDDRLTLERIGGLAADAYWRAVAARLAALPKGRRHALVFIHGYNVSFAEAAIRAAQIGFDLGIEGAMAFFSWPSRGAADDYPVDGAAIEASERAIAEFLADFARKSGADKVHIIAHSMGNRGLLRALAWILGQKGMRRGCRFGQFLLAAPDVDAGTFALHAGAYRKMGKGTTLYVSAKDKALGLSRWLHDYPRVGLTPPVSIFPSIDTVNVTQVDLTMLGHSYVAEARPVLADMHQTIFFAAPPDRRAFLEAQEDGEGRRYWLVRG